MNQTQAESRPEAKLPVVYVRGYAGSSSGINRAVDDPFYGFNLGSTHVRVGREGDPIFYQFESPMLRLLNEEKYQLIVEGSQEAYLDRQADGEVPRESIWIHRFYDVSASTFGEKPQDFSLTSAAENLLELIEKLKVKTGAPRVHLVAHSMGGLICRCLIQKIIPDKHPDKAATDYVERLFTYGTPHGGIKFDVGFGLIEKARDEFGIGGAHVFGPDEMYQYLTPEAELESRPPKNWNPKEMPDSENFPLDRLFCLVGTNPQDYDAAFGLSSRAVGAKSDGLVQIENAYVPGANHAFVHRSHSGRYGLVNSEEGYQNLRRFLFGDIKVTANLVGLPSKVLRGDDGIVWQAEMRLSVRGLPIVMSEQLAAHYCPIQLTEPDIDTADHPVPLITTYLWRNVTSEPSARRRYVLHLRILSLRQRGGLFDFSKHLEQTPDFDDVLIVDIEPRENWPVAWAEWNSLIGEALSDYAPQGDPLQDEDAAPGTWKATVKLPPSGAFLGDKAALTMTATQRG